MRLLLRAALRAKRYSTWFVVSLITLFGMTFANQLEIVTIGVIANNGTDFFALFGKKDSVSKEDVNKLWDKIDRDQSGVITKKEAARFLSKKSDNHPLRKYLNKINSKFQEGENRLYKIVAALLIVALLKGFFLFFGRYTTRILAIKISSDLRQQYFNHIQELSMSFYQRYNIGSLSTRVVADSQQIALSINSWITNYLHAPFTLISTLSCCFYLSWKLTLVIFLGVPLIVIPVRIITRKVKKVTRVIQKNQESFASVLIDFLAGIQTVKIFSMEKYTDKKYREQNEMMDLLECKASRYDLLTRPILHFVTTLCLVLILFFGLYILKMQLAELVVYCGLLHLFYEPIRKFADENANVQRGIVAAERLFEVLSIQPEIIDDPDAIPIQHFNHSIVFDHVWFKYGEEWILKDVSFTVEKGQTVAIVGATGSGKSTILQLLPRLYDVTEGEIYIDKRPITDYTQKSLRHLISFVSQKPFLFNDTVRANIAYGRQVTEEEIVLAAKRAHADEFIIELAGGYDAHLAEMGKNLSGGQQQRLAIARALAKKAPILILDEATSSLDSLSELKIKEAIVGLQGEITQIIVAHRLSTIEHADKIIFIEKGIKVAEGPIEELLKTCPGFALMWQAANMGDYSRT